MKSLVVALAATALAATSAFAQQQGVTKDEIVIGTIQDLSGPIAAFGKQTRGGMVEGQCVGAVGVSGVKSSEDAQIARIGIAAVAA